MTSEQDMSLQVESSSAAHLSSSLEGFDGRPLFENHSLSSSSKVELSSVVDMHEKRKSDFGGEDKKEGDRPIVSMVRPGQNSPEGNATRRNFAEPPRNTADTINSSFPSLFHEEGVLMGLSHQQQHHNNTSNTAQQRNTLNDFNNVISHLPETSLQSPFPTIEGGTGNEDNHTLTWGTGGLFTTPSGYLGSIPKPAEPALGLMTGRVPSHESKLFPSQQTYQHQPAHSSLTLLTQQQQHLQQQHHRPPIQQHTATAAEIALGAQSSSFDQSRAMGDGNQFVSRHTLEQAITSKQDSKSAESSNSSFRGKDSGDEETSRTEDTVPVNSSGRMTPPLHDSSGHVADHHRMTMVVGTPSTVSTAPSSDDASLGTDYKLDDSLLPNLLHPLGNHHQHRRASSWGEEALLPSSAGFVTPPRHTASEFQNQNPWLNPSPAPPQRLQPPQHRAWEGVNQALVQSQYPPQQQRIATFRNEITWGNHAMPTIQHHNPSGIVHQPHQQVAAYQQQSPSPQKQHIPQLKTQNSQGSRKQTYAHQAAHSPVTPHSAASHGMTPPVSTPPKNSRQQRPGARQAISSNQHISQHPSNSSSRSASEILKTLLRKKACLYEPDTSRSVALVTWLVGRELALEHGFFSRQQLQSGVHACVAGKIESGAITRTKVNRCMQIILNSCFHYIIPRSDGSEENGDHFREVFLATVKDDSAMLQNLPEPWNDLQVDRATVLEATLHDSDERTVSSSGKSPSATPKSSPKLGSVNGEKSPDRDSHDGEKDDSKRAVLLCFNENVRCAEDVFRCHNEFIRDTANAAHLQLTAQEWRQFFGREVSRAPYLWGNVGIPTLTGESSAGPPRRPDLLGQMSREEASQFRTTWCTKRYEHDHDLCGFAHVEVNGGWLRRNPSVYPYKDEMCKFISTAGDKLIGPSHFFLNECPKGVRCDHAHSMEEIVYHPSRYKTKVCTSLYSQSRGCRSGDVCPNLHPPDVTKPMRKAEMMRSQGGRRGKHEQSYSSAKTSISLPDGSPVVYASPAPFSSFDNLLGMPGLQSLFRRQSAVIRAHVRSGGKAKCLYSPFGDDWGVSVALAPRESNERAPAKSSEVRDKLGR